jgi:hypothetical protein
MFLLSKKLKREHLPKPDVSLAQYARFDSTKRQNCIFLELWLNRAENVA